MLLMLTVLSIGLVQAQTKKLKKHEKRNFIRRYKP